MNSTLETRRARRYIATGGDQIELKPPSRPANKPTARCHIDPAPKDIFVPTIWLSENNIMAKPIVIEIIDLGKDIMNRDVKNMLTIKDKPISQYFFAISTRFSHLKY